MMDANARLESWEAEKGTRKITFSSHLIVENNFRELFRRGLLSKWHSDGVSPWHVGKGNEERSWIYNVVTRDREKIRWQHR